MARLWTTKRIRDLLGDLWQVDPVEPDRYPPSTIEQAFGAASPGEGVGWRAQLRGESKPSPGRARVVLIPIGVDETLAAALALTAFGRGNVKET